MQLIVNVILYGKTLVKSALLLDIRKNTAYTHNAALSVVRLTRVLSYKSAYCLQHLYRSSHTPSIVSSGGETIDLKQHF